VHLALLQPWPPLTSDLKNLLSNAHSRDEHLCRVSFKSIHYVRRYCITRNRQRNRRTRQWTDRWMHRQLDGRPKNINALRYYRWPRHNNILKDFLSNPTQPTDGPNPCPSMMHTQHDDRPLLLHLHWTFFRNSWWHQEATGSNDNAESYHHFQLISGEEWQHRHRYDLSHTFSYPAHLVVKLMQPAPVQHTHTVQFIHCVMCALVVLLIKATYLLTYLLTRRSRTQEYRRQLASEVFVFYRSTVWNSLPPYQWIRAGVTESLSHCTVINISSAVVASLQSWHRLQTPWLTYLRKHIILMAFFHVNHHNFVLQVRRFPPLIYIPFFTCFNEAI